MKTMSISRFNQLDLNRYPLKEILFCPNTPKPLHGMSPRSILGDEWWDKERIKAYRKFFNHCQACGVHKSDALYHRWLEAHEVFNFDYPFIASGITGNRRHMSRLPQLYSRRSDGKFSPCWIV
jgi:hypothetical protein